MKTGLFCAFALLACGASGGDSPSTTKSNPLGDGPRIADLRTANCHGNPDRGAKNGSSVSVQGATVVAVDSFDETRDGKSRGTIHIQDFGATKPLSGISLYSPTFVPADLRVAPGDVLDFKGPYQEASAIGTANFGTFFLTQLARPVGTFRFESPPPSPVEINVNDLVDFNVGCKWVGMLVTIKNYEIVATAEPRDIPKGRVNIYLAGDLNDPRGTNAPALSNELFDLKPEMAPLGKKFTSITGVVTFFFNLKIAPRSANDLVAAE